MEGWESIPFHFARDHICLAVAPTLNKTNVSNDPFKGVNICSHVFL